MARRPILTPTGVALAAASGLATAALSPREHPRLVRGLSACLAAGAGAAVAVGASKGWTTATEPAESAPVPKSAPVPGSARVPVPFALALGAVTALAVAGLGEVGLRAQAAAEQWAERTTGRPRLVVGLGGAAVYLVTEVLDRALDTPAPDEAAR